MVRSMTAYGRSDKATSYGRLVIEIHSVNRKMLDIAVYLPKDLLCFDIQVRKALAAKLQRGQVTARITLHSDGALQGANKGIAQELRNLKKDWEQISSELGFDPKKEIDLAFLLSQIQENNGKNDYYEDSQLGSLLDKGVLEALDELIRMKEIEAKALVLDIRERLEAIAAALKEIEAQKVPSMLNYQQRITQRLEELGSLSEDVRERIYREVAFLIEKADISEEITRAYSHIQQFYTHLESQKESVGKTLDFLLQEMNREINTLGAKAVEVQLSNRVVEIKSELEKIREQVQNIE